MTDRVVGVIASCPRCGEFRQLEDEDAAKYIAQTLTERIDVTHKCPDGELSVLLMIEVEGP